MLSWWRWWHQVANWSCPHGMAIFCTMMKSSKSMWCCQAGLYETGWQAEHAKFQHDDDLRWHCRVVPHVTTRCTPYGYLVEERCSGWRQQHHYGHIWHNDACESSVCKWWEGPGHLRSTCSHREAMHAPRAWSWSSSSWCFISQPHLRCWPIGSPMSMAHWAGGTHCVRGAIRLQRICGAHFFCLWLNWHIQPLCVFLHMHMFTHAYLSGCLITWHTMVCGAIRLQRTCRAYLFMILDFR